jgi:imidazolonepropionase-like amidohydrolase
MDKRSGMARQLFGGRASLLVALVALVALGGCGEPAAKSFERVTASVFAITHVRVIDGTGAAARDDQSIVVRDGRIAAAATAATVRIPDGARAIDGRGRTLIPGLVGMHEHLFYGIADGFYPSDAAFARLYLASGVTTIRTAGAVDLYEDLRIKEAIDAGRLPGPRVYLTSPYIDASDPDTVAREVESYAAKGVTSFKAYTTIRSPELRALIDAAHARGLRVTGHLCAVGFREAAAMGIDNLEHGLAVDTEFYHAKEPDVCPDQGRAMGEMASMDPATDGGIHQLLQDLVRRGVAVTSTLAVLESLTGDSDAFDPRMPAVLAPRMRRIYDRMLPERSDRTTAGARAMGALVSREMQFERMFANAGGRLMAGADPTGWGGIVAGFADQRELELLVDAGLTPEAAIRVATLNGADFLYESEHVGSVEVGKRADLVLLRGNPAARISDVRNVEMVFKDGVGYDPDALIAASAGTVGDYNYRIVLRWPYNLLLFALIGLRTRRIVKWWRTRGRAWNSPATADGLAVIARAEPGA